MFEVVVSVDLAGTWLERSNIYFTRSATVGVFDVSDVVVVVVAGVETDGAEFVLLCVEPVFRVGTELA